MFRSSLTRVTFLAALLSTLAIVNVSNAADTTAATPATGATTTQAPSTKSTGRHHEMKPPTPEEMKAHVEERISTLHDKLSITSDQEAAWGDVAQAMRDNEATISGLIQDRHDASTADRTAIDDLESYQKIAQAHADGLTKVTTAFEKLYNDMSDEQKKNADKVFGTFEGHMGMEHKHGTMKNKATPAPAAKP
jgi:hypothetical protein